MKKYIYVLIVLLFTPTLLKLPIFNDGGAYAYMGTLFFDGMLPYQDGWDHKGISMYLINALGYLLGFKNLYGIRILELVLMILSFSMLFNSLRERFSEKAAFLSLLFGIFTFRYFFDGGNLTEEFATYFVLISISLLLKKKTLPKHYIIIGFLFLISFTIRANLIGFWISLFLYEFVQFLLKKNNRLLYKIGYMFVGFLIAFTGLGIYFLVTGSFESFYAYAFSYNFSYTKNSFLNIIGSTISVMRRYELSILLIAGLLISTLQIIKKKGDFIKGILVIWIPIELYLSNMSGKQFAHYFLTWTPMLILSTIVIIQYIKNEIMQPEKRYVLISLTFFLCFQIPLFLVTNDYKKLLQGFEHKTESVAEHISKNYTTNQILIWGNGISIYSLLEKRAPIPYFYQTFLKVENKFSKEFATDLAQKFNNNLPELVIDAKTKSMIYLDKSNKEDVSESMLKYTKEFFDVFEERYELKESKYNMDFYVLIRDE